MNDKAVTCMRFPFSIACHLDNSIGVHRDVVNWKCRLHARVEQAATGLWFITHPRYWR